MSPSLWKPWVAAPALEQGDELPVSPTGVSLCPTDHNADAVRDADVLRARQRARLLRDGRGRGTCPAPCSSCAQLQPLLAWPHARQQSHERHEKRNKLWAKETKLYSNKLKSCGQRNLSKFWLTWATPTWAKVATGSHLLVLQPSHNHPKKIRLQYGPEKHHHWRVWWQAEHFLLNQLSVYSCCLLFSIRQYLKGKKYVW